MILMYNLFNHLLRFCFDVSVVCLLIFLGENSFVWRKFTVHVAIVHFDDCFLLCILASDEKAKSFVAPADGYICNEFAIVDFKSTLLCEI